MLGGSARRKGQTVTDASKPARSAEELELAAGLVEPARAEGVDLAGPGGLLVGLTKTVREAGLEAELAEHVGYERHRPARTRGQDRRQ